MSRLKWIQIIASALIIVGAIFTIIIFPKLSVQIKSLVFSIFSLLLAGSLLLFIRQNFKHTDSKNSSDDDSKQKPLNSYVLVVDDNMANRRILNEMLSSLSFAVIEAHSGSQTLELYQKYPFKIIFMDIEMQEMSGLDTSKAIRAQEKPQHRIPIVATSAHSGNDKKLLALASGCDDYLTKPIDIEQLKITIDRWLNTQLSQESELTTKRNSIKTDSKSHINANNVDQALTYEQELSNDNAENETKRVVDIKKSLAYSRDNKELAKDMLKMLITMVSEEKNNMLRLFQEEQWSELGNLVHKLNGGSCYCGVPELQKHAQELDQAIEGNKLDSAKKLFPELIQAMEDLLAWQEEYDLDVIFDI